MISFIQWLENKAETDALIKNAQSTIKNAALVAVKRKKNPLTAAQTAAINSGVPVNKLGKVLPKDEDQEDQL